MNEASSILLRLMQFCRDTVLFLKIQVHTDIVQIIQVLHILKENLQSPDTIFFGVSRNQTAKICSKVN